MERQDGSTDGTDPNSQQDPYGQQGEQAGQPSGQTEGSEGHGFDAPSAPAWGEAPSAPAWGEAPSAPSWGSDAYAYPAAEGTSPGAGSPSYPSSGGSAPPPPQAGFPDAAAPQGAEPGYGMPSYGGSPSAPAPVAGGSSVPHDGPGGPQAPSFGDGSYPGAGSPSGTGPGQPPIAGASGGDGKKKSKLGWILGGIGGCLVLLLIAIVIIVVAVRALAGGSSAGGDQSAEEAIPAAATGYLQAIADGDADAAFSYLDPDYGTAQGILMTDEALAVSMEQAPITQIEATLANDPSASTVGDVNVSYLIGDTEVNETWSFFEADDGSWKLYGGTGTLYLYNLEGLGATVNGVAIEDETDLDVFPGYYTIAIDQEYLDLDGEVSALVSAPNESADFYELETVLNDEGEEYARGLVQDAVNTCLEETAREAGCGLSVPETLSDGTDIGEDTVERSLPDTTQATLDDLEFTPDYDDPTTVTSEYIGTVDITAECTQGGRSGRCEILLGPSLGSATVDLVAEEPKVLWD